MSFVYLLSPLYLLYFPFIGVLVLLVVVLAAAGKSLGIRELLVQMLVAIFEWGSNLDLPEDESSEEEEDVMTTEEEKTERPRRAKRSSSTNDLRIIERDHSDIIDSKLSGKHHDGQPRTSVSLLVDDSLDFITAGIESIIEDQVTSRFRAEQLPSWNLLSRTKYSFQHISPKLTALWIAGCLVRYFLLVPIRVCLFAVGMCCMVFITSVVGYVPNKTVKKWLNKHAMLMSMRICARAFSGIIRFHDRQNRATHGGICVANHTSPMDVMVLSNDNCYAMIGQRQGGLLGFIQRSLSRAESHIWFERSEVNDRKAVSNRMREHVSDPDKLPIIIFPEGTCINNTSVMMFKKGSFEIGSTIYPIALKYDSRLGDAFWNSQEQSYGEYLWMMMTSWAIICDVWYLPAMTRMEGEDSIAFARRVKRAIAKKGGLVDLEWDGMLKREKVSTKVIELQQKLYFDRLSRNTSLCNNESEADRQTLDIFRNMSDADRARLLQKLDDADENQDLMSMMNDFQAASAATTAGNKKED